MQLSGTTKSLAESKLADYFHFSVNYCHRTEDAVQRAALIFRHRLVYKPVVALILPRNDARMIACNSPTVPQVHPHLVQALLLSSVYPLPNSVTSGSSILSLQYE